MMTKTHGSGAPDLGRKLGLTPARWRGYLGAPGAVAVAPALRWGFDPYFGSDFAFLTYFAKVALSAMLAGWQAGMLATVLSGLAADFFFLEPRGSLAPQTAGGWLGRPGH